MNMDKYKWIDKAIQILIFTPLLLGFGSIVLFSITFLVYIIMPSNILYLAVLYLGQFILVSLTTFLVFLGILFILYHIYKFYLRKKRK